jgi:hypothetical protein
MLAEAAVAAGHRVRLLDLMFQTDLAGALAAALHRDPPEVVGLSVRNLDNNDMQAPVEFVTELAEIARTVQRLSDAPLVLGGPALGVMPEALLRLTGAAAAGRGRQSQPDPRRLPEPSLAARGQPPVQPAAGAPADVAAYPGHFRRVVRALGRDI